MKTQEEKLCSVEDCNSDRYGHGFCVKHYFRNKKYGNPFFSKKTYGMSVLERLNHYSKKVGDCIEWQSIISSKGYGILNVDGKMGSVHRLSYELNIGEIENGKIICHKCDNRKCLNPEHLFMGTYKENTQDMISKSRQSKGTDRYNSKLNEIDVFNIRKLLANGLTQTGVAKTYDVSTSTIHNIKKGHSWSWLK